MNDDNMEVNPISGEAIRNGRSWNIIWDLQGTHGTAIDRQHYAINVGTPARLPTEIINSYRGSSRPWHQLWSTAVIAGLLKHKVKVYGGGEAGSSNIEGIVR